MPRRVPAPAPTRCPAGGWPCTLTRGSRRAQSARIPPGRVGGAVVHGEHLEVRIRLDLQGSDGLLEMGLAIANRQENGDRGRRGQPTLLRAARLRRMWSDTWSPYASTKSSRQSDPCTVPRHPGAPHEHCEGGHPLVVEGGVLQRDLLAGIDGPASHHVEPLQPGRRLTGVVQGSPRLRILAPRHPHLVGEGPRVAREPLLVSLVPARLHLGEGDQVVRLLLEGDDALARGDKPAWRRCRSRLLAAEAPATPGHAAACRFNAGGHHLTGEALVSRRDR